MLPPNLVFGGNSPSACSTDSDPDLIGLQHYARPQLSHSDTEDTTWQNRTGSLSETDMNRAVSESSIWEMPSCERTRSESTLLQMDGSPMLAHGEPQADDFIPQLPLLSQFFHTERHVPTTSNKALLPTSSNENLQPTTLTPVIPPVLMPKPPLPTTVIGTIIHSPSATSTHTLPQFHPLAISTLEAQFHIQDPPTPIPSLIGLPLWMRNHNTFSTSTISSSSPDLETEPPNEPARALYICTTLSSPNFGTSPPHTGSKLLMRADGANLLPQHLEALCHFCLYVLHSSCGDAGRLSSRPRRREKQERVFKEMATRRGFEEFWGEYCEGRAEGDERWRGLPGPYDCGGCGRGYERVVSGTVNEEYGGEEKADMGERTALRTEGLVTRGLARKRERGSEADGRGRRGRESEEVSSEGSDVLPPSKRRRRGDSGKVGSSQSSPRNEES